MSKIILIGCGKTKEPCGCPAKDLYTGGLFRDRRGYAEAEARSAGAVWRIVSAKYGMIEPRQVVDPYDLHILDLSKGARQAWGARVVDGLQDLSMWGYGPTVELHMGAAYVDAIFSAIDMLRLGWFFDRPLEGMGVGKQRAWYAARRREREGVV